MRSYCTPAAEVPAEIAVPEDLEVASIVVVGVVDIGLGVLRMAADPNFDHLEAAVEDIQIVVVGRLEEDSTLTWFTCKRDVVLGNGRGLCITRITKDLIIRLYTSKILRGLHGY